MEVLNYVENVINLVRLLFRLIKKSFSKHIAMYPLYKQSKRDINNNVPENPEWSVDLVPVYRELKKKEEIVVTKDDSNTISIFNKWWNTYDIIILQGERGIGKTTLIKHVLDIYTVDFYRKMKKYVISRKKENIDAVYLPIFFDSDTLNKVVCEERVGNITPILDNLKNILKKNLMHFGTEKLKELNSLSDLAEYIEAKLKFLNLNCSCGLMICIDGINELSADILNAIKNELSNFYKSYKGTPVIKFLITTRYRISPIHSIVFEANELNSERVKKFLNEQGVIYYTEKDISLLKTPMLVIKYLRWKQSQGKDERNEFISRLGFKDFIENTTDIYWNSICADIEKMYGQEENEKLVEYKYILLMYFTPFLAFSLEERVSKSLSSNDVYKEYRFDKKYFMDCYNDYFEKKVSLIPIRDDILNKYGCGFDWTFYQCPQNGNSIFALEFLINMGVIKSINNVEFVFVHELDHIFYTALYYFHKDIILFHNPKVEDKNIKTTIGKCFRVFYSNLMVNYIFEGTKDQKKEKKELTDETYGSCNLSKLRCIESDLYYYGDIVGEKDEPVNFCIKAINEQGDDTSINWAIWSIFFIYLDQMKKDEDTDYIPKFKELFGYLIKNDKWRDYKPIYDKLGYIFFDPKIFDLFKSFLEQLNKTDVTDVRIRNFIAQIFSDIGFQWSDSDGISVINLENNREEIMMSFFKKAADGGYHFACNKLGSIYEKKSKYDEAFEQYEKSFYYEHSDYYAVGKMLQFINNGFKGATTKCAKILNIAEKAYTHIKAVSPVMDCKNIHGYPLLLMSLGDYYYNKGAPSEAFEMYKENYLLHEADDFCYDKCRLMISFLAKKHSEECCIDSFISDEFAYTNYDEFRAKYENIDEATLKVLNAYKELD